MATDIGAKAILSEATDLSNRQEVTRLVKLIKSKTNSATPIGVLGLSYKPDTNVTVASQGVLLAQALVKEGYPVVAYDPVAIEDARQVLGEQVLFTESAEECIQDSEVIVIATPWKCFKKLEPWTFNPQYSPKRRKILIDCWRILDASKFGLVADYIPLGGGPVW